MKTVLIAASYSPSLVNFRGALISAMRTRGHQVHACAPGLPDDQATRAWLEERGVVCHDVPLRRAGLNPLQDLQALLALVCLMRRIRPSVFLGYTIKPVIWGMLAARWARVPERVALITGLGYAFTGEAMGVRAFVQRLVRTLYSFALRSATLTFFQNPDDMADLQRLKVLPKNAAIGLVNGSGVDIERFNLAALPKGPTRFLLIARLLGDKGIREYVEAARRLSSRWPRVEFHLIGGIDPNPNGIARAEAESWSRDPHFIWHGALDDVRSAISACHVYVLPSYREGTPRTVLEAMSMGRPVVTTDAPGCRETVERGRNGFLIPVRDPEALAEAMEYFLLEPELVRKMGENSRKIAEDKFDVNKVNTVMMDAMKLS
ncbi:glycosyltransferase family 4 protein [Sulfitobacter sp. R18_1]|uniref:glycosyltransferase family 4 protein n=1 Tax=Sulfitobacter sp. R18_1 TaxID=2821104 RepID=UPI001ADAF8C8|nr:glycosyltransferase family 4 protein [Sulfitobacter sp. R18_1]MBO9432193.1 glycosyltransferase family 4 protein [Sulfitobacter sp. R18_1]